MRFNKGVTRFDLFYSLAFAVVLAAALLYLSPAQKTNAQGSGPAVITVFGGAAGNHTACGPVSALGSASFCHATDGLWQSVNGGAWVQLGSGGAAAVTINGKTGTTFTIGATAQAPQVTTTAPTVTASAPSSTATAPAVGITVQ